MAGNRWRQDFTLVHCRRQRLAKKLMDDLEDITEKVHKAYFVDLFVRVSNASAIRMYNKVRQHLTSLQQQHNVLSLPSVSFDSLVTNA